MGHTYYGNSRPSEALRAFMAEGDRAFEEARLARLAKIPRGAPKHVRALAAVESIWEALQAKFNAINDCPEHLLDESRVHFGHVVNQMESHKRHLARQRAQFEIDDAEHRRGRIVARANAQIGIDKTLAAIEAEETRHGEALADAATHSAIEKEEAKHARTMSALLTKLENAFAAADAAGDG